MSFSKQRSRSNYFPAVMASESAIKRKDSKEVSPKQPPPAIARDTEPFPDLTAPIKARNSEDAHCKPHCRHEVCKDVYQQRAPFPRCTCTRTHPTQQLQPTIGAPFEITVTLLRKAAHLNATFPPDGTITLHQQDALAIF
ncbi:hypothetical protein BCR34DRAFT_586138 [Clohesyomyces aquaticus]|uniref:Uncharacterized protein n=1 Tax=Clohesyomyces aquaticus TaxID=1231657 RepID=A0A1Y1ZVW7_9PLEO|nr:hypothetical protein BCR34DRAFT_586138 [Clohesyomyces aquaticus]